MKTNSFEIANPWSNLNICVIDDDLDIVFFISKALEGEHRMTSYSWKMDNGHLGLENYLKSNNVDLFILDVNLPGTNGFEIGERIREICEKEVPIVYTSVSENFDEYINHNQPSTYFMPKPFGINDVFNAVDKIKLFI